MRITERPEWGAWVTPKLLRQRPIYRWYVYPHSYDKELVQSLLEYMQVPQGSWVWDPFVGAGTTLLACREYGCSAIGTDLLPLSILISQSKTHKYNSETLARQLKAFSFKLPKVVSDHFAPVPIIARALTPHRRREISFLLDQIDVLHGSSKGFFRVALLRAMEDVATVVKSGGWLRIDPDRENTQPLRELFLSYSQQMLNDLQAIPNAAPRNLKIQVKRGDARTIKTRHTVSACITSPPYLNRHDYTRVFALELALVGVNSPDALIQLRRRTLRSHVEALAPASTHAPIQLPRAVSEILAQIESIGANDGRIPRMIKGYFEDMFLVMGNIARNLRAGGKAALVVGNTRFSGVMIPVDEILMAIGPRTGLKPEQILVTRSRGNSAQQMGAFGRDPARESVVIFEKISDGATSSN
jgi:hypothetical protein